MPKNPPALLLLSHCRSLKHLKTAHAKAITSGGLATDPSMALAKILYNFTLLQPLPSIDYALSLFNQIPNPSTFSYNILMRAHTLLSFPLPALRLFATMRRLSVPPDFHTFPFAIKACVRIGAIAIGCTLHSQAVRFGFIGDVFVVNNLISLYSISKFMTDAHRIFDEIPWRDVVSFNTLIDGYVKNGQLDLARKIFDEMPMRDAVSCGTLLVGYSQRNQCHEALKLFDWMMLASGLKPDDVSLASALSCCAQLGELDRGRRIHNYIRHSRIGLNVFLSTALVDMYTKCGCLGVARDIFETSPHKNLFTWNAIIVGFAMHGHGELSLEYFNRMQAARILPDGITFLGVLVGCSHAGLVDMARRIFNEMESVYGAKHELKHYGCMADLLGRAGLIKEAMQMIEDMPMEGDVYVWGGVLGGCGIHGDVEVAEIAAQHLLELNPGDSGIYSIMSNIYAGAGRWEDVSRIRKLMDDRKVKKSIGSSSIQADGVSDELIAKENCTV